MGITMGTGKHSTWEALRLWLAWREERTRAEIIAASKPQKVATGGLQGYKPGSSVVNNATQEQHQMTFVIRSMSTTDYVPAGYGRPEQKPVPYHVYLKPADKRAGAWWSRSMFEAQKFDTEAEAIAERDRLFANEKYSKPQVAPADADAQGIHPFWHRETAAA